VPSVTHDRSLCESASVTPVHWQGIKTWPDGDSYCGQWSIGRKHGFGKYAWAGAKSCSGGWNEDTMHGHGTYTFDNGDSYTGAWESDVKTGVGTYRFGDGHLELRVFADVAAACPDSSVVPGECPKTGRKFVHSMSCLHHTPGRLSGGLRYSVSPSASPRRLNFFDSPISTLNSARDTR